MQAGVSCRSRSEEHTSELQSLRHLVCRLLLEKKKTELFWVAEAGGEVVGNAGPGRDGGREEGGERVGPVCAGWDGVRGWFYLLSVFFLKLRRPPASPFFPSPALSR